MIFKLNIKIDNREAILSIHKFNKPTNPSIISLYHHCVKIFKTDLPISVRINLFQHNFQRLVIHIFLQVLVDFPQIIQVNISLIGAVILLENCSNLFPSLVYVRLSVHRLHKLSETYTTCFLLIKLSHNFINSFLVWLESVLSQ